MHNQIVTSAQNAKEVPIVKINQSTYTQKQKYFILTYDKSLKITFHGNDGKFTLSWKPNYKVTFKISNIGKPIILTYTPSGI